MDGKSILTIGVDEATLQELRAELGDYLIFDAPDAEQALEVATENRPLLVLLGASHRDRGGFEVIRALKGNPATKRIRAIMLSDDGNISDVEEAHKLGVVYHSSKPFIFAYLVDRIVMLAMREMEHEQCNVERLV